MNARLHTMLYEANCARFTPSLPRPFDWECLRAESELKVLELELLELERKQVAHRAAAAPTTPEGFVRWFEDLKATGPGQGDPLFPWLAQHATAQEMRWFLAQETAGEAGFEDLVALTQVKVSPRAKLELARNYWDELGRGHASAMHGPMLERMSRELDLEAELTQAPPVWESLALANVMVAMAANRCYAFHSIGALGGIELTAPGRATLVNAGLTRLGVPAQARQYFALHATLDVKHSAAWNAEVIAPLVAEDPRRATAIAEGALIRLAAGQRCFDRYRRELQVGAASAVAHDLPMALAS